MNAIGHLVFRLARCFLRGRTEGTRPRVLRAFISSPSTGLGSLRKQAIEAFALLRDFTPIHMERRGAKPDPPNEVDVREVQSCDCFVALVGPCYGNSPPTIARSYAELEYEAAIEAKIPRFVFLTPEDFKPLPEEMESEDKQALQRKFRDRVRKDQPPIWLTICPQSFKAEFVTSLRDWWDELREGYSLAGEIDPGDIVPLMCDRESQERVFRVEFAKGVREQPGMPQVFVLPGPEQECPGSLVKRLARKTLLEGGVTALAHPTGGVLPIRINGRTVTCCKSFVEEVFLKYADKRDKNESNSWSAEEFVRVTRGHLEPVHVIECQMAIEQWTELQHGFLKECLEFWDAVGAAQPAIQIVVFLCFTYPPKERFFARIGLGRRRPDQVKEGVLAIRKARQVPANGSALCRCTQLDALPSITPDDVRDWFDYYSTCPDKGIWQEKCDRLFQGMKRLPMERVESSLLQVHSEFQIRRKNR